MPPWPAPRRPAPPPEPADSVSDDDDAAATREGPDVVAARAQLVKKFQR